MSIRARTRSARRAVIVQAVKVNTLRSRYIVHRKKGERASKLRRSLARARKELRVRKRDYEVLKKLLNRPLRTKALAEARELIGVMEKGGNNRGPEVEALIREGGGLPGQAWCGWFCAAVYKRAGSKAVEWRWGAVRLLRFVTGVKRVADPLPGDLVVFNFDHVGLFVRKVNGTTIQTIEGNTGTSGAVSDSKTGGDGVYEKNRPVSQVAYYLRVTR